MAERSDGKQGLVPKTFLKVYSKARLPTQERLLVEVHKAAAASSSASPSTQEEKKILTQNYARDRAIHQGNDRQVEQNVVLRGVEMPESVSTMPARNAEERMRSMPEKMTEQVTVDCLLLEAITSRTDGTASEGLLLKFRICCFIRVSNTDIRNFRRRKDLMFPMLVEVGETRYCRCLDAGLR